MRIKDDGRGIDVERVVAKAIEMGALTAEAAQKLSEAERLNLIFLSRLSTKTEVSAISGRGVGMDAVKGVVEETLGGQVSVTSTIGAGTEFCLTIPLRGGQVTQLKAA
jgi:two-component system chemotaxis sensor kinase CheA